jgi:hypothetical protein
MKLVFTGETCVESRFLLQVRLHGIVFYLMAG